MSGPFGQHRDVETTNVELIVVVLGGKPKVVSHDQPDPLKLVEDCVYIPEIDRVEQTEASLSENYFNLWFKPHTETAQLRVVRGYIPLAIDSEHRFHGFVRNVPAMAEGDVLLLSGPTAKCWFSPNTNRHEHGLSFGRIDVESRA